MSNSAKHTPGPWSPRGDDDGIAILSSSTTGFAAARRIAFVWFDRSVKEEDDHAVADADLILAAPEAAESLDALCCHLRYALKQNPDCFGAGRASVEKSLARAEAVLAKSHPQESL